MKQMPGFGMGNPYNFMVGYGEKKNMWTSPWIDKIFPKDIMPNTSNKSKRKNCAAWKALENNFLVYQIDIHNSFNMDIQQFVSIGELVSSVHLNKQVCDIIKWKLTTIGNTPPHGPQDEI
jgi:hypothetical protein